MTLTNQRDRYNFYVYKILHIFRVKRFWKSSSMTFNVNIQMIEQAACIVSAVRFIDGYSLVKNIPPFIQVISKLQPETLSFEKDVCNAYIYVLQVYYCILLCNVIVIDNVMGTVIMTVVC